MIASLEDTTYDIDTPATNPTRSEFEREPDQISPEEIAAEAYALYLARGSEDGHDVEDWLAAEEILRHRRTEDGRTDPAPTPLHIVAANGGPRDQPDGVGEPDEPEEGLPDEDEDDKMDKKSTPERRRRSR